MKTKTKYTLLPLPGLVRAPFFRRILDPAESWQPHSSPYQTLPLLECHIAPPFTAINAGPKCAGADLDAIARECCQATETQQALKDRLELLCDMWNLFENTNDNAKDWKRKRGVRGRGSATMRILKEFRNRANAPLGHSLVHRVVVQDESLLQLAKLAIQPEISVGVLEPMSSRRRRLAHANGNGHVVQVEPPSVNTQCHV
jgi:hypothetical protein